LFDDYRRLKANIKLVGTPTRNHPVLALDIGGLDCDTGTCWERGTRHPHITHRRSPGCDTRWSDHCGQFRSNLSLKGSSARTEDGWVMDACS
jgi:hypothetical protein